MYDQELDRDPAVPSCQRLKTLARGHIDQMIRTRNFTARNERIGRGVSVKSHKGKNVSVERRMGECHRWKANGQCSRGDSCSISHGSNRGQKAQSSSLVPPAQTQIDGRKRRMIFGILPYVHTTSLNRDANSATCLFRHTEADRQPSEKSKKNGGKGSVALLWKSLNNWAEEVYSQIAPSHSLRARGTT